MNKPIDHKARKIITEELDKNLLVEAGAGSGKTTSLVDRMVESIRRGKYKIGEMAAITFTRKAALEMQERFQTVLERELERCGDIEVRARLEDAVRDINLVYIGTVHAFCARILKERPVEAGIDPQFNEEEESTDSISSQQAWYEYTTIVHSHFPDLINIGVDPGELKDAYKNMCTYPDVKWMSDLIDKPDLKEALEATKVFINKVKGGIPDKPLTNMGYDALQEAVIKAQRILEHKELKEDKDIVAFLSLFKKKVCITQNRWLSKEDAKDAKLEAEILYEEHIGPAINQWQVYAHYYITEFLKGAVGYYEDYRTRTSTLNFQDLLMKAAALLKDNAEVRLYFQEKYRSLVVDEFQDTDPIQAEIIFYLTGENVEEKNWQKLVPRPGSLFVVGDPKQSIYRFMRADIDTYNLVQKLLVKNGGQVVRLTANFRSVKSIGNFLNPIFKKAFKDMPHQAEYAGIDAFNDDIAGSNYGVRSIEVPEEYKAIDEIVRYEAESIAKIIKEAVAGGMKLSRNGSDIVEVPEFKDFLILTKTRKRMDVYAKALEEYGIPVKMTGGSNIGDSTELRELLNLLRCIESTEDQIGLVAVLKGLFFGISDNALYEYRVKGGGFNIFRPIPEDLDLKCREQFEYAFDKLKSYYRWSRKYSPSVVVEKIIEDLGLVQYANQQEMSKSRVCVVYDVLERLFLEEAAGVTEFRAIVERLGSILEAGLEEELDIFIQENRVRIMNLHKAKGLEASVVFLANPVSGGSHGVSYHIKRENNEAKGYFTYTRSDRSDDGSKKFYGSKPVTGVPLDWEGHCVEEEAYLEAEGLRLVYVAATRAKNLLYVSRLGYECKKKNPWGLLADEMKEEQVVLVPDVMPVTKGVGEGEIGLEEVTQIREKLSEWPSNLVKESYILSSPTAVKNGELLWSVEREEGGGRDRGSALHYILEQLVKSNGDVDINELISGTLLEFGLPSESRDVFVGIVERFISSDLYGRIVSSLEKQVEVPFSFRVDKGHGLYETYGSDDSAVSVILSGIIDLVFKEVDGWVVVDYKSDRVKRDEDYATLESAYMGQLDSYGTILSEITGEGVKEKRVVFLER